MQPRRMATNDDEEEHQDEKEEMETTVREIHSFVRFVSIRIFCVMPLHGRTFWPRARSISSSWCVPEKTQSTCTVCIIFHKNCCPHSTSLIPTFLLSISSWPRQTNAITLKNCTQHIHIHGIAFLDALLTPCLHTWIVCTFCSYVHGDAAAVANTFFLVVKQFPVERVKVGDAFHHGIHSTVFDRHLHSLIQTYAHTHISPCNPLPNIHTHTNTKLCNIFKRVNTFLKIHKYPKQKFTSSPITNFSLKYMTVQLDFSPWGNSTLWW